MTKAVFRALWVVLALGVSIQSGYAQPGGGDVHALQLDPSNPEIIYAATGGGVIKSSNGGNLWTSINWGLPNGQAQALAIAPSDPAVLYVGIEGGGVYRSTDGGTSWSLANSNYWGGINAMAVDPFTPSTLYAATRSGVFQSIDGGASWTYGLGLGVYTEVRTLTIDKSNPSTIYAGTAANGVFKTVDGGSTWFGINSGMDYQHTDAVAVDPSNSATVYAGVGSFGVWKSTNGGTSWGMFNSGLPQAVNVKSLAIDPLTPATIYIGTSGSGFFKSTNGGASWTSLGSGMAKYTWHWALAISPANPSTLYAGTFGGGVFKSIDGGISWTSVGTTLYALSSFAMSVSAPSVVYAGTWYGGVFRGTSPGGSWIALNAGLGTNVGVTALAIDPSTPATLYAGTYDGGVFKSINGGATWVASNSGLPSFQSVTGIVIDPFTPATVYAGTDRSGSGGGIYKSLNGGSSWVSASVGLGNTSISALVMDLANPTTLYVGAGTRVFKSTDGGASWTSASTELPSVVETLAIDPSTSGTLYAGTTGGGVFRSKDGGVSWAAIGPTARAYILSLAIDPSASALYAGFADGSSGAGGGVYKSIDGGDSWAVTNSGLTRDNVRILTIDPLTPTTLYAATDFSGLFWSTDAGATWRPTGSSGSTAAFVSETIPDNTTLIPGQAYTKTWTLRNTGPTTWTPAYNLQYDSGDAGCSRTPVAVTGTVPPTATFTFSINCTAPTPLATYREDWRLVAPGGGTIKVGTSPTIWEQVSVVAGVLLQFGAIASPQVVDTPFQVTIKAVDALGLIDTAFQAQVPLTSTVGVVSPSRVTFVNGLATAMVSIGQPTPDVQLKMALRGVTSLSHAFAVTGATHLIDVYATVLDPMGQPVVGVGVMAGLQQLSPTTQFGAAMGSVMCGQSLFFSVNGQFGALGQLVFVRCDRPTAVTLRIRGSTCNLTGKIPIILLPGILGSTTGERWLVPTLPVGDAPDFDYHDWGTRFSTLDFTKSGYGLFDPVWGSPFGQPEYRVGWWPLIQSLEAQGYEVGCTIFPAPYDWRLPIDQIVNRYLSLVVAEAKAKSGQQKVDIVAHSMGGLVARAYIQDQRRFASDAEVDIRKLAMIGTPNMGAVKAYYLWEGGDTSRADGDDPITLYKNTIQYLWEQDQGIGTLVTTNAPIGLSKLQVKQFVQTRVPSARQLLPTFAFLRRVPSTALTSLPSGRDNWWLKSLNASAPWGNDFQNLTLRGVLLRAFVGIGPGIDTPDPHLTSDSLVVATQLPYEDGGPIGVHNDARGDGTVLARSVLLEGSGLSLPTPFVNASRTDSQTGSQTRSTHAHLVAATLYGSDGVVQFLTGSAANPAPLPSPWPPPGNSQPGPSALEVVIKGPAIARIERSNQPGIYTGVLPSLQPVVDLPASSLEIFDGNLRISLGAPFLLDGTGGTLRLHIDPVGSGVVEVFSALATDAGAENQNLRVHTSHGSRTLLLTWNQTTQSFTVDVGANPPAMVTTVPSGGATRVDWSAVPGATGYRVFRRLDGYPTFDLVATLSGNALTWLSVDDPWSGTVDVSPAQFAVSTLAGAEESAFSAIVTNTDQDGDGLSDADEAAAGTNPLVPDTDADGLNDRTEVEIGTNPLIADTDGDGVSDGVEYSVGSDPQNASVVTGPAPEIAAVVPATAVAGQAVTVAVNGGAFFAGVSVVRVAGQAVPTTFVNSGRLQATVSAAALCPVGPCAITVNNPAPGGGISNVANLQVQPSLSANLVQNGDFSNGTSGWQPYATPDMSYVVSQVTGGLFEYYRVPPPAGTSNQAVVFQETGVPLPANAPLAATFSLGNSSSVRKRISVLILDSNFSDLSVCTFWLPPNTPLATYQMQTHTTQAWANAAIYFYAASAGQNGGFYQLDNVSLQYAPAQSAEQTTCVDPTVPAPSGGVAGPSLLTNGDFGTGMLPQWGTYGTITAQINTGVFEFIKPASTPPAGVVLQATSQAIAANEILTANFQLGNSSSVRKRVTVLLHDNDFSDLAACTFWLPPGQALSNYALRTFATQAWTNATVSVYPATVGTEQWIRLDNVSLQRTPSATITGTECAEPGMAPLMLTQAPPPASQTVVAFAMTLTTPTPGSTGRTASAVDATGGTSVSGAGPLLARGDVNGWVGDGFTRVDGALGPDGQPVWAADETARGPAVLQLVAPLDLRGVTRASLRVASWRTVAAAVAEVQVQVSVNGGGWASVGTVPRSDGWDQVTIDLSEAAGGLVDVRFVVDGRTPAEPGGWWLSGLEVVTEP